MAPTPEMGVLNYGGSSSSSGGGGAMMPPTPQMGLVNYGSMQGTFNIFAHEAGSSSSTGASTRAPTTAVGSSLTAKGQKANNGLPLVSTSSSSSSISPSPPFLPCTLPPRVMLTI